MVEHRQLFISCEHGGNQVPPHFQALFRGQEERLNSHSGYDPGALPFARMLAKGMAVPLEKSETTRLLIDKNRSLHNRNLFSDLTRKLNRVEKKLLVEQYYAPYRAAVSSRINDLIQNGAQVVHLAVHTFTPILYGKVRHADVGLLYDPVRREEKHFSHNWRDLLKQKMPNLRVRCNYPYRGTSDGLIKTLRSSQLPDDYLGIELEVNQALLHGRDKFPHSLESCFLATLKELFSSD